MRGLKSGLGPLGGVENAESNIEYSGVHVVFWHFGAQPVLGSARHSDHFLQKYPGGAGNRVCSSADRRGILLYRRFCAGCHRLGAGFSELLL